MAAKIPTAEEVIALVERNDAMQQLIAQAQAQQAQALADQHAQALAEHHALVAQAVELADVHMVVAPVDSSVTAASAMDFMPLATAAVVIDSPSSLSGNATMDGSTAGVGTPSSSAPLRRKSIPLSLKKEAIEWIMGPGKGVPSRAEKHFSALNWDVSASSFRKWWKNREKILSDASHKKRITGGGRKPFLELGEEKLLVVVIQERAKKDRVTRKWIAKTAQHMFQRSDATFKASENWVTKFIRRNGLTLKRSYVTYEQQLPVLGHMDDDEHRSDGAHFQLEDHDVDDEHMGHVGHPREHEAGAADDPHKTCVCVS